MKAFTRYYLIVNTINIMFCLLTAIMGNILWTLFLFCSVGIVIGIIGFNYYYKNEYYFYYNLGYTRGKLARMVFIFNIILTLPFLLLILIFS